MMPDTVYGNLEAEMALIGCAINSPGSCLKLVTETEAEDWLEDKHRIIVGCLKELERERIPVDLISVSDFLSKRGTLESAGGGVYLVDCSDKGFLPSNARHYLGIIQECAMRRKLYRIGKELMEKTGTTEDPEEIRDWTARTVRDMHLGSAVPLIPMEEAVLNTYEQIERDQPRPGEPSKRILSGIASLDNKLGGLRGGEYVAIGARPSVGKSILALTFCVNAARQGKKVLLVSLEMNEVQITERMMAGAGDVPLSRITGESMDDESWQGLARTVGPLSSLPMWISLEANTVARVRKAAYSLYENSGLDMIAVDYLQLMEAEYARKQSRQEQISEISRGLRLLAAELKIPIIVLTQLNRSSVSERVDGKRVKREPTMSDARESGSIEQDANIFILMHNPAKDEMQTESEKATWEKLDKQGMTMMRLIIDKNRQGKRGRLTVAFDGDHMRFAPIVRAQG